MPEVMKLEYVAATESLLVSLDAVKDGVTYVGLPLPTTRMLLSDLSPKLREKVVGVLAEIYGEARAWLEGQSKKGAAGLDERAAALAIAEQAMAEKMAEIEAKMASLKP